MVAPSLGLAPRLDPLLAQGMDAARPRRRSAGWPGSARWCSCPGSRRACWWSRRCWSTAGSRCCWRATAALALAPFLRSLALPPAWRRLCSSTGCWRRWRWAGPGSFPGRRPFVLAAAAAAGSALITIGLHRPLAAWGLPLLVLPFNVVVLIRLVRDAPAHARPATEGGRLRARIARAEPAVSSDADAARRPPAARRGGVCAAVSRRLALHAGRRRRAHASGRLAARVRLRGMRGGWAVPRRRHRRPIASTPITVTACRCWRRRTEPS